MRSAAATGWMSFGEYAYSGLNLVSETQNGEIITRENDEFGRPHTLSLSVYGSPYCYLAENAYDPFSGRLSSVRICAYNGSLENPLYSDQRFDYAYLPGSDLPQSVAGAVWDEVGAQWVPALTASRAYEAGRDLVSAVSNLWGGAPVSSHVYANDVLGRRRLRRDFDGAQFAAVNHFYYNARSEVESTLMGPHAYSYAYDSMGNRVSSEADGEVVSCDANALNQYTSISNQQSVIRIPVYDLDGNMTSDGGGWHLFWDAENRLACVSNATTVVRNTYDHLSRRIRKGVYVEDSGSWVLASDTSFLYDGWNLIGEYVWDMAAQQWRVVLYSRGLDLSGGMQGAGGVGGLLAVTDFTEDVWGAQAGATYFPTYDANGNVTEYVENWSGSTVAAFAYDAFGNTISEAVSPGLHLPHRFSTKYLDRETGMSYYGYRFYSPELGRWPSRDPIEERGGLNLYGFIGNDPVNRWDKLGLSFWNCCDDCTETIIDSTEVRVFPASHRDDYLSTIEHGKSLLDALGAGANGSDVSDLAMSMTSLSGVLLSAARIAISRGMNAGGDAALNNGLQKLQSNLDSTYGMASGYLAMVKIRHRPCNVTKTCWKRKPYKTWGSAKTKADITPGNYNPDPAYQGFGIGYRLPDEQKAFTEAIRNMLKETINGLP